MNSYCDPTVQVQSGTPGDAHMLPILYSFRRCPYAIRARMALYASGVPFETVEVSLRNKPARLIELSPKATVPVLVLPGDKVIDESLDIMRWALGQSDPQNWLRQSQLQSDLAQTSESDPPAILLKANDTDFKHWLDRYKYPVRYPDEGIDVAHARAMAMQALIWPLSHALQSERWLGGGRRAWRMLPSFHLFASSPESNQHGFKNPCRSPFSPGYKAGWTARCLNESCARRRGEAAFGLTRDLFCASLVLCFSGI
ncbi:glutathione S-transferase N-terminal domain-containing protein [Orrella marina]|uniref:glutathione S-transferase N-terminal domain-containing protein n=1 Tax=Orrella marina TaxID=2163011 RepID=UPI001D131269|nr:glutathione S-transferase N-terminal domain-containing protein [Orrella marina]